jgi:hypothetical protein
VAPTDSSLNSTLPVKDGLVRQGTWRCLKHGGRLSPDSVQSLLAKHVRVASDRCPLLASKRVSPHVLRHYVSFRTMSLAFGFGLVFPANIFGQWLHSLGSFYQPCTGATSHEWYTVDKQIVLSRLQEAFWQAHIGLFAKIIE